MATQTQTQTQTQTDIARMPDHQRHAVREMDDAALMDFQLRLQIECGMSHAQSVAYIAQARADQGDDR